MEIEQTNRTRQIRAIIVLALTALAVSGLCALTNKKNVKNTEEKDIVFESSLGVSFDIDNESIEYFEGNKQLRFNGSVKNSNFEGFRLRFSDIKADGSSEYVGETQLDIPVGSAIVSDNYCENVEDAFAINFTSGCSRPKEVTLRLIFENEKLGVKIVSTPFIIDIDNKTCSKAYVDTKETSYKPDESKINILKNKLLDLGINIEETDVAVYGDEKLGYIIVNNINEFQLYNVNIDETNGIEIRTDKFELTINKGKGNIQDNYKIDYNITDNAGGYAELTYQDTKNSLVIVKISTGVMNREDFTKLANTIIYSYSEVNFDSTVLID